MDEEEGPAKTASNGYSPAGALTLTANLSSAAARSGVGPGYGVARDCQPEWGEGQGMLGCQSVERWVGMVQGPRACYERSGS